MTKKHYEAIAEIMNKYSHHPDWIPEKLADYFAQDNPKFNRDRFLTACGVIEEKCTCKHLRIGNCAEYNCNCLKHKS